MDCYSEFDPIGDTERQSKHHENRGSSPGYSEFDPIGDTESFSLLGTIAQSSVLQRVRSDRGY